MPQIGFFVAAASAPLGGAGLLLAWDRYDRGPAGADDIDLYGLALYSWLVPTTGAKLIRMTAKQPVKLPEDACPTYLDGFPDHDYVCHLEFKPAADGLGPFGDVSLELFDGSERIYSVAESKSRKFELSDNSVLSTSISVHDRPTVQPWEDHLEGWAKLINDSLPSRELWRALMTPNQPVTWF